MLPLPTSINFPKALEIRRLELNLTRLELSRKLHMDRKMIDRYEKPDSKYFAIPKTKTWVALNKALGYVIETEEVSRPLDTVKIKVPRVPWLCSVNNLKEKHNTIVEFKTEWQPCSPYYHKLH